MSCSLAIALVEIAKLVSNLNTLVLSVAFFVGVNAGGGDKDLKMKVIRKPSWVWILSFVRMAEIPPVLSLAADAFYR